MNPRELLQSAQTAEREGDLRRAGAFLERAARLYEKTGHPARAAQMRRHIERLGPQAREGAGSAPEPARSTEVEASPDGLLDPGFAGGQALIERAPTLAEPGMEAWCSFCCRPAREVGRLVAGPAQAFICSACTTLAASLLSGEGER